MTTHISDDAWNEKVAQRTAAELAMAVERERREEAEAEYRAQQFLGTLTTQEKIAHEMAALAEQAREGYEEAVEAARIARAQGRERIRIQAEKDKQYKQRHAQEQRVARVAQRQQERRDAEINEAANESAQRLMETLAVLPQQPARHVAAFDIWYRLDRSFRKTSAETAITEGTLRKWAQRHDWWRRADEMDAEVERLAARTALKRRADMLERHRKAGELMVARATQFFRNNDSHTTPIERAADAINAMAKGIDIERTAESLPSWIFDLLEADDATLATIIRQAASDQERIDSGNSVTVVDATAEYVEPAGREPIIDDAEWEPNGVDEERYGDNDTAEPEAPDEDAL